MSTSTPAEAALPVEGLLETVVYAADLAAARRFYEGVIGLRPHSIEPDRHLFYRVGDSMLLIFNPHNTRGSTVRVGGASIPRHGAEGQGHFAFQVAPAQMPAVKVRLQEQQIAIESEIDWPAGGQSIYCRDPAGNSVEFATRRLWFAEAEAPAGPAGE